MLTLALVCGTADTAVAQWLSLPLPGTPRTSDGKPNLNAPTPRAVVAVLPALSRGGAATPPEPWQLSHA